MKVKPTVRCSMPIVSRGAKSTGESHNSRSHQIHLVFLLLCRGRDHISERFAAPGDIESVKVKCVRLRRGQRRSERVARNRLLNFNLHLIAFDVT